MAMHGKTVVTEPTEEPLTISEICQHLRIEEDEANEHSLYLDTLIRTAREVTEHYLSRQFVTATWDLFYDDFPGGRVPVEVDLPPLQSVTTVKYYTSDVLTEWDSANYVVDTDTVPGRIEPIEDVDWPDVDERVNGVEIRAVCGYGGSRDVPDSIKHAMKVLIGHWYNNPDCVGEIPMGVEQLLNRERWTVFA